MLSRNHRYSFRNGVPKERVKSPFFVLRYQINDDYQVRFAIVISKKIDKRATARNEVKRKISHALHNLLRDNQLSVDVIIYVRKAILGVDVSEIEKAFQQIFLKEAIIKNHD